jgi:hypothetical protein
MLCSIRHAWRGKRLNPRDEHARRAWEDELRRGGVYPEFSRPTAADIREQDRLLVRARNNVSPPWTRLARSARWAGGVYEGMGVLSGIRNTRARAAHGSYR